MSNATYELKEYMISAITNLRDKGYMTIDLIKMGIFTTEEIQEMQDIKLD